MSRSPTLSPALESSCGPSIVTGASQHRTIGLSIAPILQSASLREWLSRGGEIRRGASRRLRLLSPPFSGRPAARSSDGKLLTDSNSNLINRISRSTNGFGENERCMFWNSGCGRTEEYCIALPRLTAAEVWCSGLSVRVADTRHPTTVREKVSRA
jgi:hypothetical protein